ncbi:Chloroperoxidase [Lentinula boryana]|uniref:Chloroperoxidase n=1 Tax=Lentinula boryana TaxID=40481 RepID=A0ABQ8QMX1_9AGAR|nr:Chloroperoxidase [Lentinula boryana]
MLTEDTTYDATLTNAYPNARHGQTIKRTITVKFDPSSQYVSTTGTHAFVPPGPNDLRGPCPGLNAMANHGYIPHSGIATIDEFAQATYKVFGMGKDLSLLIPIYATALDGDILSLSLSIGNGTNTILGPIFSGTGLTCSHNNFEGDVSPTRGDLYEYGNNHDVQMSQFLQLYNLQSNVSDPSQVNFETDILTAFRLLRFKQSIANNPYFFNGPITGVLIQPGNYQFIFHLMANKSEEYPEGRLDREVLKSFFSITGPEDNLAYTPGHERIPDNWYKRAIGDEYGLVSLLLETTSIGLAHPEFLSVGGNTGQVDTFTGVDFANLTGGVFNATTLLEGNNLGCFLLQAIVLVLPTSVSELLRVLEGIVDPLLKVWDCPRLQEINESLLDDYPGSSMQPESSCRPVVERSRDT